MYPVINNQEIEALQYQETEDAPYEAYLVVIPEPIPDSITTLERIDQSLQEIASYLEHDERISAGDIAIARTVLEDPASLRLVGEICGDIEAL